jgi:AAA+ superfamily predicted ATPase
MYSIKCYSTNNIFIKINYYIIKLTNYKKRILYRHDYLLQNNIKMSFIYKKNKINIITYGKDDNIVGLEYEPSTLTNIELLSNKIETLNTFIKESEEIYHNDHYFEKDSISIWTPTNYGYWDFYTNLQMRNIESVMLDKNVKEDIINDIDIFKNNSKLYDKYGMPYKRVYCIYGPPGTGKSSLIFSIASKLNKNIAMLNFGSGITDESFIKLMSNLPLNSILLLEDIDALFVDRKSSSDSGTGFLSFSTLLNILDGNLRVNGLLTFMTTNYANKLDSALLRKGRIDYKIKIDYISKYQIESFAKLYYPKITKIELNKFITNLLKIKKLTSSELSNFLFINIKLNISEILIKLTKQNLQNNNIKINNNTIKNNLNNLNKNNNNKKKIINEKK